MTREQVQWINEKVSMKELLRELGVEIPRNGQVFCPFHDNTRTPAAKYYEDSNKLWCFAEQKMYFSYDCMRKLEYSQERILALLPDDLSEFEAKDYKMMFPIVSEDTKKILTEGEQEFLVQNKSQVSKSCRNI